MFFLILTLLNAAKGNVPNGFVYYHEIITQGIPSFFGIPLVFHRYTKNICKIWRLEIWIYWEKNVQFGKYRKLLEHRLYKKWYEILNVHKLWTNWSWSNRVFYDCLKLIYGYLNEKDNVCESYSCLKIIAKAYWHDAFFTICFIKRAFFKRFCLFVNLLQLSTIFNQKYNHKESCD